MKNHSAAQMKPKEPVMIKAHFHPHATAMNGTDNGAKTAPMLAPELNIPVANALSFFGNHSAIVLMAAGKFPDSATPKVARAIMNPNVLCANAWPTAARLQSNPAKK